MSRPRGAVTSWSERPDEIAHFDARNDIYSRGVLLDELLVGTTSSDPEKMRKKADGAI